MSYDKYERGHQHLNGGHQRITYQKKKLTPRLTQSNQWVRVDHASQIHSPSSPRMTNSVEKKENGSDDDMYDMLEIYEQCGCILWIINAKKTKKNPDGTHSHVTQNRRQKS